MSRKYWLCKRGKIYYSLNSETGKRESLQTGDKEEAARIIHAKNDASRQPSINITMKMTVLDVPVRELERHPERLTRAIEAETRFGVGASFKNRRQHEVLDADWDVSPVTKQNKDRAWSQLGSSGSGNHFVEFGLFTAHGQIHGLEPGTYLALLSHSGSRGTGAAVCDHYSKLAFGQFPDLPSEQKRLAWLSLDSEGGQEYWAAMRQAISTPTAYGMTVLSVASTPPIGRP
jgi:hypothetical protein